MTSKTEIVAVQANELQVIEYRGQRVVTTEQMASGYGASVKNIQDNYQNNRQRFLEGKHLFRLEGDELRELKNRPEIFGVVGKNARSLILWTERGAANHAKMLETEQAWGYHDDLVEFYFTRREAAPALPDLSRLEILQMALNSEQGRIAEKQRADHAVRTKSQISRKREASALGKLSAATRRCRELEERLGESTKDATITKVEKETGRKGAFSFVALRRWCKEHGQQARNVADERWGSVKSWPAGAWLAVYDIDLKSIFGSKK